MSIKKIRNRISILSLILMMIGCSDSATGPETQFDTSAIIKNEGNNIILQTYVNLDAEAGKLVTAVNNLQANTTSATLAAAQKQWRATREPWENSESFLFGPVAVKGIDPAIDSWPLDQNNLKNVLSNNENLTKSYIDAQPNRIKGFHTIEFLLFGASNNKKAGDFTSREFDYLLATTQSLKGETQRLVTAWQPSGDNYIAQFLSTENSSLQDLVTGMEDIANEVGNGKIGGPFNDKDPNSVESQFSFNSKVDFQNNLRSIQHIYTGDYNGHTGAGVSDYIVEQNADVDARFKQELDAAITAIGNIQSNFRSAITENPESVENAQEAVLKVLHTIQADIQPLI